MTAGFHLDLSPGTHHFISDLTDINASVSAHHGTHMALAFSLSGLEVLDPVHESGEVRYLQQLASGANLSVWDCGAACQPYAGRR
jgi:hypothetical protein